MLVQKKREPQKGARNLLLIKHRQVRFFSKYFEDLVRIPFEKHKKAVRYCGTTRYCYVSFADWLPRSRILQRNKKANIMNADFQSLLSSFLVPLLI
jgi:hypothetical protein